MHSTTVPVAASERFLLGHRKLSPELRRQTRLAIADLADRYGRAIPLDTKQVRRIAGVRAQVWRMRLNDAARMLYRWDGQQVMLLDVGNHEVTRRYSDQQYRRDIRSLTDASHLLAADGESRFIEEPDTAYIPYHGSESRKEWLYFLDDEQDSVCDTVLSAALTLKRRRRSAVHFLLGGPGTGKTSILVNLLDLLREQPTIEVRFHASDEITRFLGSHLPFEVAPYVHQFGDDGDGTPRVVLVDDPGTLEVVEALCETAVLARNQVVVAAFDPLQLDKSVPDSEYEAFVQKYGVVEHQLKACYRQRRNVGRATRRIAESVARSTPFVDTFKIDAHRRNRANLTALANEVEFRNPSGYVRRHAQTTGDTVTSELQRIHECDGLLDHWPYMLIAYEAAVAGRVSRLLKDAPARHYARPLARGLIREVELNAVKAIKGTEYQHALVFISEALYRQVEDGFCGTGQRVYEQRRLLRIPFSRARDSLVTFVL